MTPLFKDIQTKCFIWNTNLTAVCREAGIHRSVPERWKRAEPKTRRTVERIYRAIEKVAGVTPGTFDVPEYSESETVETSR